MPAKNNEPSGLCGRWSCSTFPATPTGRPGGSPGGGRPPAGVTRWDGRPTRRVNPGVDGRPRLREYGHRPSGDPSGSSIGLRPADRKVCKSPRKRGERSSDRTPLGQASGDSSRSRVPGPMKTDESPERAKASAEARSGFLACSPGCILSGFRPFGHVRSIRDGSTARRNNEISRNQERT